ncbi:hypothetical protein NHJ6243_005361 [Beauveria neobassiana]
MPLRERLARFGDSLSAPDKPYLDYFAIRLTVADVRSLKYEWLTDNIIGFWQEYLERETLPRYPEARVCLLRPSVAIMLKADKVDDTAMAGNLPDPSKVTHLFLPINDNVELSEPSGGSHWSLLLVSLRDGRAFHYDSSGETNRKHANDTTVRLARVLHRKLDFVHLEDTPNQGQTSDCGVYVCLLMRHLLVKRLLSASARSKVNMSMGGKVVDSSGGRKEMLGIIENLRKEAERRHRRPAYAETVSEYSCDPVSPPARSLHSDRDVPLPAASSHTMIAGDHLKSHEILPVHSPASKKSKKRSSHSSTPSIPNGSSIKLIPRSPRPYSITFPDGHSSVSSDDSLGRREPRHSKGERSTASTQSSGSSTRQGQSDHALPQEDSSESESGSIWSYRVRYKPRSSSYTAARVPDSSATYDAAATTGSATLWRAAYLASAPAASQQ